MDGDGWDYARQVEQSVESRDATIRQLRTELSGMRKDDSALRLKLIEYLKPHVKGVPLDMANDIMKIVYWHYH